MQKILQKSWQMWASTASQLWWINYKTLYNKGASMEYIKLGNSNLKVSRICLGCMGFGDSKNGRHSWTLD